MTDGVVSVQQAIANNWATGVVVLVAIAILVANVGPTFIRLAYQHREWLAVVLLSFGFAVCAAVSYYLTLQRVGDQTNETVHAYDQRDLPRVVATRQLARAEKALSRAQDAKARAEIERARSQQTRDKAASDMEFQEFHAPTPGRGSDWRDARSARDNASLRVDAAVDAVRTATADISDAKAKIARIERVLDGIAPAPDPPHLWLLKWISYAVAAFSLPASIGLLLIGTSSREFQRVPLDPPQFQFVPPGQNGTNWHQAEPIHTKWNASEPSETSRPAPPETSGREYVDPCDRSCNEIVQEIVKRAIEHQRVPTWSDIKHGYDLPKSTASRYRRLAMERIRFEGDTLERRGQKPIVIRY